MNKKDVAGRLGVSVRLVEKYASEGRLGEVIYVRGKTGKQADFAEDEVERLKAELESVDTALMVAPNRRAAGLAGPLGQDFMQLLAAAVAQAAARNHSAPVETLSVADKLTLSLIEAALVSGLSRNHLRAAIEAKKLKARIIGRGWKIKRDDLDLYVRKL
jgi:excisionase family DNA binding protein